MKKRLSKKEWNLLIICIIIISAMLADAALRQAYLRFSRLKEEVRSAELELGRLNRILGQKEKIESGYEEAISGLRQIRTPDDFLKEIENFARGADLNIRNIKPLDTKEEDLYKIYSVRIEVQDDILTLAKFLHSFTEELKYIGVKRFHINAQSKKELPMASLMISAVAFKE